MNYSFVVSPVPASRPRVTRRGVFYGKKYTKFRAEMKAVTAIMEFSPITEGAIFVETCIWLPMPKSWSKKKKALMCGAWKCSGADNDNYEKAVWDCLNGLTWGDDCQIAYNVTRVRYAYEPLIELTVEKL